MFVRAVQVYDSNWIYLQLDANTYLEKKDLTFLEEYISATTSLVTPKYYAMRTVEQLVDTSSSNLDL